MPAPVRSWDGLSLDPVCVVRPDEHTESTKGTTSVRKKTCILEDTGGACLRLALQDPTEIPNLLKSNFIGDQAVQMGVNAPFTCCDDLVKTSLI